MLELLTNNKRIVINTIASYSRTILAIGLTLFSSRWVLHYLGVYDFGLFSLIGSILAIVSFLNTVLANGDARFIAIEIGKGANGNLLKVFKVELVLHIVISIIILTIGYFLATIVVKNFLIIENNRIDAALHVLQMSFILAFFSFISAPFYALFIAHQDILFSSIISLLQTFLIFVSAYIIRFFDADLLVLYSFLFVISHIVPCVIFILYAKKRYLYKSILNIGFDFILAKDILKYSFWNFLGDLGHLVRIQGITIVTNLLYGTQGNAALGIANQLAIQSSNLTNSLTNATSPEINRRFGAGNKNLISFANIISKISTMLVLALAIPIIINLKSILNIWLIEIPDDTNFLCLMFIIMYIVEKTVVGELQLLKAINKVAKVQVLIFIGYSLAILLPYMGLHNLFGIKCIGISCLLSMIITRLSIALCAKQYIHFNVNSFLIKQVIPLIFIIIIIYYLSSFDNSHNSIMDILAISLIADSVFIPTYAFLTFGWKNVYSHITKIKEQ